MSCVIWQLFYISQGDSQSYCPTVVYRTLWTIAFGHWSHEKSMGLFTIFRGNGLNCFLDNTCTGNLWFSWLLSNCTSMDAHNYDRLHLFVRNVANWKINGMIYFRAQYIFTIANCFKDGKIMASTYVCVLW
jgi:hypothetical protein